MEFLVRCDTLLPDSLTGDELAQLKSRERARAMELRQEGTLKRLWRIPGRRSVVGLWDAGDATALHEALSSLPQFPWMDISVEPLAMHPQEQ